ncbi:DUF2795 domain-containing protein [Amycolatopsis aidingensis]|uniref:DUF2795 domain-containing protein n=1 Tax=Amycolatopsis aidingensis TaxID=2842453 RepID=UPI001C0BF962|nr:DUF2795 domain-containing protein [Amycolatopsis aidingensis]
MANQPEAIEVQKFLSGVDYPASRDQLVRHAQQQGAGETELESLRSIADREYDGPNAVSAEVARHS